MWWDILKNAKLSAKGKGKTLDTSRLKVNVQNNECNKQLKAWADKIKGMPLILKQRYNENKLMQKHFDVNDDEKITEANTTDTPLTVFSLRLKEKRNNYLYEMSYYHYTPVPEKVACKAIDMLKNSTSTGYDGGKNVYIDGYQIFVSNLFEYQDNNVFVVVVKDNLTLIRIGWSNGEDVNGNDEFYKDFPRGEGTNKDIFSVSGYYDAHKIVYGWWK